MGAINHQPCNKYLAISTFMSRALTLGRAELELANVSLEDILLAELRDEIGELEPVLKHLNESRAALRSMLQTVDTLRQKMDEEKFEDLSSLAKADLDLFGDQCSYSGLHRDSLSWKMVAGMMNRGGFYAVLNCFEDNIRALITDTTDVATAVMSSHKLVRDGKLSEVLENNGPGNFKFEFFKLYSSWEEFYQVFQASSIISTELWYRFNNNGSVLGSGVPTRAVA